MNLNRISSGPETPTELNVNGRQCPARILQLQKRKERSAMRQSAGGRLWTDVWMNGRRAGGHFRSVLRPLCGDVNGAAVPLSSEGYKVSESNGAQGGCGGS
uniref:Uncharacterized protein n=1 Tax=Setaria digitata TaxID=48799 RepID=A0A915PZY2_9BILA